MVACPILDSGFRIEYAGPGGDLASGARRGRDADDMGASAPHLAPGAPVAAYPQLLVFGELAFVAKEQRHRLGGVNGAPAAHGYDKVAATAAEGLDGVLYGGQGGLDRDVGVDAHTQAGIPKGLLGSLRQPQSVYYWVGDEQRGFVPQSG